MTIIPANALQELAKLLGDEKDPVQIHVAAGQVVFRLGSVELVTRLIEGNFPNYHQLIPTRCDTRATVAAPELLKAVRVAALFARDAANVVRLDLAAERITVSAGADRVGDNASELAAVVEGPSTRVAFSSKFLAQVLQAAGEAQVVLELTAPTNPVRFRLVGDDGFVHVIMPMHIGPPPAAA
jgi:DNA polymerase-3 subunit beta